MAIRVYLDTSVYNRPFDDQTQPRIWLETLAFSIILQLIESGEVELVSSSVVEYENSRHPHLLQKQWVRRVCELAIHDQNVNDGIRERATELEGSGIKPLDALHLACAEVARVDYFVSCDDRLLRRYRSLAHALVQVTVPTEFVRVTVKE
jgi:predicted nucleic acid-binding protein